MYLRSVFTTLGPITYSFGLQHRVEELDRSLECTLFARLDFWVALYDPNRISFDQPSHRMDHAPYLPSQQTHAYILPSTIVRKNGALATG